MRSWQYGHGFGGDGRAVEHGREDAGIAVEDSGTRGSADEGKDGEVKQEYVLTKLSTI
jgi:hypothetical protein